MKISSVAATALLFGCLLGPKQSLSDDSCERVKGTLSSMIANCPGNVDPALYFCTQGHFDGDFEADFSYMASLSDLVVLDNGIGSIQGDITLSNIDRCEGTISAVDYAHVTLDGFENVASIQVTTEGTDECAHVTAILRVEGIFQGGCVDCEFDGEICGASSSSDNDNE